MPLTTDQIYYIRHYSGDHEVEYEVDDDRLQVIYDSTVEGISNLNRTVFYVILRRLGLAAAGVSVGSPQTGLQVSKNQKYWQLKDLLALWSGITGISIDGAALIGTSAVYTYRADSLQTEAPTYPAVSTEGEWDV